MLDFIKNMLAKSQNNNHEKSSHNIPSKFVIFSTPRTGSTQKRDRSPKSFMDQIWKQDFGYKAIGFKLMLWQNKKAFDLVLKNKDIKKYYFFVVTS